MTKTIKTTRQCRKVSITLAIMLLACSRLSAASTIQFSVSTATVVEGAGNVALDVRRQDDLDATVGVDLATADGTALAGLKYTAVAGTLTFAAGETNKTIIVPILNDGIVGGTQDFQVALSNPTGGAALGERATATVRIADNDRGLGFEFGNYSVAEDAGTVLIGVLRRDDGKFPVTVDYATSDGTAKSGVDYLGVTNTLSFAAGETVKLFSIAILNDALKEPNKGFHVTLSNPTGGGVLGTPKTVTVTIPDNDPGVQFEFSNYWVSEDEGFLTVNVLRGRGADTAPFTVDYATTAGTALAGQDYVETRGTLTFAVGERSHEITMLILRNESSAADRQFKLTLINPSAGAVLGPNRTATVTVLDATGMQPHRLGGISVQPDRSVRLSFEGGVNKRFKDYFDLYPLEVSTDLATWVPWTTLQRTNASTNALTFTIPTEAGTERMFFRTAAGPLITPYRQPSGPFAVGSITRLVTDPSRRNRYGISTNGSFMITIWYPATAIAGKRRERFIHPRLEQDNTWRDSRVAHVRSLVTAAFPDAACAAEESPYPVVLCSPGWTDYRWVFSGIGPNVASHGYVVVSVDHFDARGTIFPDGTLLYGDESGISDAGFQDRVKDIKLVFQELQRWNSTDPALAGHLDLGTMAGVGFSWGGDVAGEFALLEEKIEAAVFLECSRAYGNYVKSGLPKPFLGMDSSEGGIDYSVYNNKAARNAVWFGIKPSQHIQFCDAYWFAVPEDINGGREISRTVNDWTVWFLNKHLKGLEEPMPTLKDYPRITGFKQK